MGAAAAPIAIIGGVLAGGSSIVNYFNTRDAMRDQANTSMMTGQLMAQQYQMQAAMQQQQAAMIAAQTGIYQRQVQAYIAQSNALLDQSAAYLFQAGIAEKTGSILQANELHRAAQAQREADEKAKRAATLRRQLIGGAKVQFAANGVLLESRPQAAVAMWEQDEIADLAYEMSGIKQAVDNEVWGYVWSGTQERIQGLYNAMSLTIQSKGSIIESQNALINADSARISASSATANAAAMRMQSQISLINAQSAILQGQAGAAQANAASQGALWNMIGTIGGIGMSVGTLFSSNVRPPIYGAPGTVG